MTLTYFKIFQCKLLLVKTAQTLWDSSLWNQAIVYYTKTLLVIGQKWNESLEMSHYQILKQWQESEELQKWFTKKQVCHTKRNIHIFRHHGWWWNNPCMGTKTTWQMKKKCIMQDISLQLPSMMPECVFIYLIAYINSAQSVIKQFIDKLLI